MSFRKPLTILRRQPGTYVQGRWQEGPTVEVGVMASIQPLNANDIRSLPEGRSGASSVKVYTDVPLRRPEAGENQNSDRFVWQGRTYEIYACIAYQMGIIPHYKSLAEEVAT